MLQLLWLYWLLTLEAFRKHPCLSLSFVLNKDSFRWESRPAELVVHVRVNFIAKVVLLASFDVSPYYSLPNHKI